MIFNVGAGGASTAEAVQYDNSVSGLEADNVQGAVDELNDSLLNIEYGTVTVNENDSYTEPTAKINDIDITFSKQFKTPPHIFCEVDMFNSAEVMGGISVSQSNKTTEGFTMRVGRQISIDVTVTWIAVELK